MKSISLRSFSTGTATVTWTCLILTGCAHHYERWRSDQAAPPSAVCDQKDANPNNVMAQKVTSHRIVAANEPSASTNRHSIAKRNRDNVEFNYGEELMAIKAAKSNDWSADIGLALSGGGIRSAVFSTGVLQALHELGFLDEVGRMSTVSGGGFAGSWLMDSDHPVCGEHHCDPGSTGTKSCADYCIFSPASEHLQHLAQNGYYLTKAHYSRTKGELATRILAHTLRYPLAVMFNEVLHLEFNVNGVRTDFANAIQRTYQYENPFTVPTRETTQIFTPGFSKTTKRTLADWPVTGQRPLWIVNAHLILNEDGEPRTRNRTGDAFEITQFRGGADAVGYVRVPAQKSEATRPREHYWMNPVFASAISAAAIDSESLQPGVGGSLLPYLFNFDLGYFIHSWADGWTSEDSKGRFSKNLWYALYSPFLVHRMLNPLLGAICSTCQTNIVGRPSRDHEFRTTAKYFGLTDGGHFDNLGLYALVRRGCRLIIVVDASSDPKANNWDTAAAQARAKAFESLRHSMALILADFGARVEMNWEEFSPRPPSSLQASGFSRAPQPVFSGRIRNLPILDARGTNAEEVQILYIKAAYSPVSWSTNALSFCDVEKARSPAFPHESTMNQLYAESTVLAYRELGRQLVLANTNLFCQAFRAVRSRYKERANTSCVCDEAEDSKRD